MSVVLSPFVGTRDGSQGFEYSRWAHFHCAVSLALNWHFQEAVFMLNLSPNCIIVTSGRPPSPEQTSWNWLAKVGLTGLFLNETGKPGRGSPDFGAPWINTQLALISDPVTDFWELGQAVLPPALPVGHRRCCPLSGLFCRGEPRPPFSPPAAHLGLRSPPCSILFCFASAVWLPALYWSVAIQVSCVLKCGNNARWNLHSALSHKRSKCFYERYLANLPYLVVE